MNKDEQNKLVQNALLEEYKSLREEILSTSESSRKLLYFALVGIGILISGSFYITKPEYRLLLLIVPFFFYSLILIQLKYIFFIKGFGDHIKNHISPCIRKNLAELSSDKNESDFEFILNWESNKKNKDHYRYDKIYIFPLSLAEIGIFFIAAIMPVIIYCDLTKLIPNLSVDIILIFVNICMVVYCIILGIIYIKETNRVFL